MNSTQNQLDEHTLHVQTLFVQHRQAVMAFVLSLEPGIHEADEIVQETFVTASRKASTWTAGTNFLTWACAIARYTTLGFHRDRGRKKCRLADDVVELLADQRTHEFSVFQNRVSALRECLRRLAPRARELISLRYHGDKLPQQIANEINWTVNAVRVGLTRARGALRDCLARSAEETR